MTLSEERLLITKIRFLGGDIERLKADVEKLTHERDVLAKGIGDAAVKAGIIQAGTPLTGPQLLQLCDDLALSSAGLQSAIRKHMNMRGDDRCAGDDAELYAVLPEGDTRPARETAVTIENCQRFIECRQEGREYVSPQRRIEELENALRDIVDDAAPGEFPDLPIVDCRFQVDRASEGVAEMSVSSAIRKVVDSFSTRILNRELCEECSMGQLGLVLNEIASEIEQQPNSDNRIKKLEDALGHTRSCRSWADGPCRGDCEDCDEILDLM